MYPGGTLSIVAIQDPLVFANMFCKITLDFKFIKLSAWHFGLQLVNQMYQNWRDAIVFHEN